MLEILDLRKAYGDHQVLHGVSLALRPGTIHGLVGANGAGKTTLLHCLYGLEPDYQGTVRATAGPSLREQTGLLPYEPYFYPRLTGREYLEYCLQARGRPLVSFRGWNELLELPLDQYADDYSAGMRKKLALLALLVQDFRYLILDEPFNGLDVFAADRVLSLLRSYQPQALTFISSHNLGHIEQLATHLLVIDESEVKFWGTMDEFAHGERAALGEALLQLLHPATNQAQDLTWLTSQR